MIEEVWKRYLKEQSVEDRDSLIVHYLYLVKYMVGRLGAHFPKHIKVDDLYSSGVTGLIKAVERFDASKNAKFETYANLLIRGSIIDELRRVDWIPRSIHAKSNRLVAAESALTLKLGREPNNEELAEELEVSVQELEELLAEVKPATFLPLQAGALERQEEHAPLEERIADDSVKTSGEIAEEKESIAILEQAIKHLPKQEKKVLRLYYYEEMMLKQIGKKLGLSESRVSQIHTQALAKLRTKLIQLKT